MDTFGNKKYKTFRLVLAYCFAIASTIFVIVFLPLSFSSCSHTINQVPQYIENSTLCMCQQNIGVSPQIGAKIINATSWFQQFNGVSTPSGLDFIISNVNNVSDLIIQVDSVGLWLNFYFPIIWTNQLTTSQIDMFHLDDYLDIVDVPRFPYSCFIVYNQTGKMYNSSNECLSAIRSIIPDFNNMIEISYSDNPVVQSACGTLLYCQQAFCPSSTVVSTLLLTLSVVSAIFTFLKVVYYVSLFFLNRKEKKSRVSIMV